MVTGISGRDIRRRILDRSFAAGIGHIASALSIADILAVLYGRVLKLDDPDRDIFVLSKGHAVLALYATLSLAGRLDDETLATFGQNGTVLPGHPEPGVAGIEVATGSLGIAPGIAAGRALGLRARRSPARVIALSSDAEMNEGSFWETIMFARHHALENFTLIVEDNAQQAFGFTDDVLNLHPLEPKFQAFDWDVRSVDGHDTDALHDALSRPSDGIRPILVIARTVAGKGVPFMERKVEWHYLPMTAAQHRDALAAIADGPA